MGVVFRGFDPAIGRPVAIKIIHAGRFASSAESAELELRFAREAAAAGKLTHPNIVSIYQLVEDSEVQYLVLELVNGESLGKMLADGRARDEKTALSTLAQVADALDYAHSEGIVHRDVKPANILVRPDGRVKITDFGIARIVSQTVTQSGLTFGTPAYMSPEQIMSARVNGQADQFSLGVIAYEMLSGRRPFEANTDPGLMHQIISVEPALVHTLNPAVSARTSEVIGRALAKKPEDRFASCKEFAERLAQSLNAPGRREQDSVATATMQVSADSVPAPERERGRSGVWLWIAAALGMVGLALVAWVKWPRPVELAQATVPETSDASTTRPKPVEPPQKTAADTAAPGSTTPGAAVGKSDAIYAISPRPSKKKPVESSPKAGSHSLEEKAGKSSAPQPAADASLTANARLAEVKHATGLQFLNQSKYAEAISSFTEAIALKTDFADAYLGRCLTYIDLNGPTATQAAINMRALEDCNKAIQIRPDHAESHMYRGYVYNHQGEQVRAIQDYTEAIRLKPDYWAAYMLRGSTYSGHQPDLAIKDLTEAIRVAQSNPSRAATSYKQRGDTYRLARQYDRAIKDYDDAIRIKADFVDAYVARAAAKDGLGDKTAAAADRTRAQELKPPAVASQASTAPKPAADSLLSDARLAEVKHATGLQFLNQSKYAEAISSFTEALGLKPDFAEAYLDRCRAYNSMGSSSMNVRAVEDCGKAIQLKPDSAEAYWLRGRAYAGQSNFQRALQDYNEAIRLKPGFGAAYTDRAFLHAARNEPDLALQDYTELISIKPNESYGYFARAREYNRQLRPELAVKDCNEATRLNPSDGNAYTACGDAYQLLKQYERAIQSYSDALRIFPSYATAYIGRAAAKDALGDKPGAAADRQRAQELKK
jgi:tetratricopeptide (TPR) repeat protein